MAWVYIHSWVVFSYVNIAHVVLVENYLHSNHIKCLKINSFTINFQLEQANDSNSVKLKANSNSSSSNNNNDDDNDKNKLN